MNKFERGIIFSKKKAEFHGDLGYIEGRTLKVTDVYISI